MYTSYSITVIIREGEEEREREREGEREGCFYALTSFSDHTHQIDKLKSKQEDDK